MRQVAGAMLVAVVMATLVRTAPAPVSAATVTIEVTTADDLAGSAGSCPAATTCSLRKAIEAANAAPGSDPVIITFRASVFPAAQPATITVGGTPLPPVVRAFTTIDASAAGVIVDGSTLPGTPDGVRLVGANGAVKGLRITEFKAACLSVSGASSVIGGDRGTGSGNRVGNCGSGMTLSGQGTSVEGNHIGFAATSDDAAPVSTGIIVAASDVTIGGTAAGQSNVIGNAATGIRVGTPAGVTGVVITRNVLGRTLGGASAPVETGVSLVQKGTGTRVADNIIANTTVAGVLVGADADGATVAKNTLRRNTFAALSGLAIDLNADGLRNPNDPGDGDSGGNTLLNHPVIVRALQARVTGTACAGCTVELYRSAHQPGMPSNEGTQPVNAQLAVADATGNWDVPAPPLSPGEWITALATDTEGNTSEFAAAARVGAGAIQCGNVQLQAGWNHAGYFGTATALGPEFPGDPGRRIRAVYRWTGTGYLRWFRDTAIGRTLTSLEPGGAYWFLVDEQVTLAGGFTLTAPVQLQLKEGWNQVVYLGAASDVHDVFGTTTAAITALFRFDNDGTATRWAGWGSAGTPGYARAFADMEPCAVYAIQVSQDVTVTPPQP